MQASAIFLGQFNGLAGRYQAGLLTTNQGVQANLRVVAPRLLGFLHIAVDDVRILAMRHQRQLASLEDTLQSLLLVHQHIARRRTHKQLDTRNALCRQLYEGVSIVVSSTIEERIVHMALLRSRLKFLFQSLQRGGLRHTVRHIEITRHTTCCCSTALCVDICLLCQTRLTEMYMGVYHTWQNVTTRSIDRFIERCRGLLCGNLCDVAVF